MYIKGINEIDVFISLFYVVLIFLIASFIRNGLKDEIAKRFLMPFVTFKVLCAIFFVLIHTYFYKGGDTYLYFAGGKFLSQQIVISPVKLLNYLGSETSFYENFRYTNNYTIVSAFKNPGTFLMSKIASLYCLVTFNQFLASTILFSVTTGIGLWKLFIFFIRLYPSLYKYAAFGVLFFPTLGIWCSGILKDPIAIAAMGFIFHSTFMITQRKGYILNTVVILVSIYLCLILKPYILYILIPSVLFWVQGRISSRITNTFLRRVITPLIFLIFLGGGGFFIQSISEDAGKYSLENVQEVAEGFQNWHTYLSQTRDQSGYTLGEIDFTTIGLIQKIPEAIFVTFYRPRLDEIRNVATAFEAVQSLFLLLLTLYVLFKTGLVKSGQLIIGNSNLRSFLLFALFMGVAVGLTSYNFGALSRYKLPCIPFFIFSLGIIYFEGMKYKINTSRGLPS